MVGSTGGTCECGRIRARFSTRAEVCAADGFDHYEEFCCACLLSKMNWIYFEDDACSQCKLRQLTASDSQVALEVQQPFSRRLLDGSKAIETRNFELPAELLHRRIALVETPEGAAGISALPSIIQAGFGGARVIGHVSFGKCVEYASRAQWDADAELHLVPPDSPYAFPMDGQGQGGGAAARKWGWMVEKREPEPEEPQAVPAMRRRLRSLYLIDPPARA